MGPLPNFPPLPFLTQVSSVLPASFGVSWSQTWFTTSSLVHKIRKRHIICPHRVQSHGGSHSGTSDIWGWIILCCRGHPTHCRMFSGIPGFYPLDAISARPLSHDNQKRLQTLPTVPWTAKSLPLRTTEGELEYSNFSIISRGECGSGN